MQHLDKTYLTYVWNSWIIWNIHLQHTCVTIAIYATVDLLLKHSDENMQHTSETHETLPSNGVLLMRSSRSPTVDRQMDCDRDETREVCGSAVWGARRKARARSHGARRGASGRSCSEKDERPKDIFIEKYKLFYTGISNVHVWTRTYHYI
jgi:hypothetical protein